MNRKLKILSLVLSFAILFGTCSLAVYASDAADNFITMIEYIKEANTLDEKNELLTYAEEYLNEYLAEGGSTSDEDISDYYLEYISLKSDIESKVALCYEFISYVEAAENADGYVELKENLTAAALILPNIDKSYSEVSAFINSYNSINSSLGKEEKICVMYIEAGNQAAAATNYKQAYDAVDYGAVVERNITIHDYPGLDEAKAKLEAAKNMMSAIAIKAANFVLAVNNIGKNGSVPKGIVEAYEVYRTIDPTAPDVAFSLDKLKKAEEKYNTSVTEANTMVSDMTSLIFGIGF